MSLTRFNNSCLGGIQPVGLSCSWKYLKEGNSLSIFCSSSDLKKAVVSKSFSIDRDTRIIIDTRRINFCRSAITFFMLLYFVQQILLWPYKLPWQLFIFIDLCTGKLERFTETKLSHCGWFFVSPVFQRPRADVTHKIVDRINRMMQWVTQRTMLWILKLVS